MKYLKNQKIKKIYLPLFILALSILTAANLFRVGIVYGHDLSFHIYRVMAMVDNIKIGKYVPVYFNYLNGFGYANGLFYPDLFLIIPAFLNYIGLNLITSYKIFIILINFASIFAMYLCVYKISKEKKCAYIGMILYAVSNYRFIDFAERGALGEMLSFIFIPLIILGLYEILYDDEKKGHYLSIGLSGLCLSHVISFYMTCLFVIVILIINIKQLKDKKRLKSLIINIILPMLVTMHFWLPMIEQILSDKFKISANVKIFENIVPLVGLFIDYPLSKVFKVYLPAGIGLMYYVYMIKMIKQSKKDKFMLTITIMGIVAIILCSVKLLWKIGIIYKLLNIIQFPWRLYMFATIFLIISFSVMLKDVKINKNMKIYLVYTIVIFIINVIIISFKFTIISPLSTEIMFGEYMPKNAETMAIQNYNAKDITYERDNNIMNVNVIKNREYVEIPLLYYKGYKACNDKCYEVFKTESGLVGVKTNNEKTNLKVWYNGTKIYNITKYISISGVLLLIYKIKKDI